MKVHSIKTARHITATMVMLYPSGDSDRGRRIRSSEDTSTYLHWDVEYGARAQARPIQNGFITLGHVNVKNLKICSRMLFNSRIISLN